MNYKTEITDLQNQIKQIEQLQMENEKIRKEKDEEQKEKHRYDRYDKSLKKIDQFMKSQADSFGKLSHSFHEDKHYLQEQRQDLDKLVAIV